jgi:hypothetical protein
VKIDNVWQGLEDTQLKNKKEIKHYKSFKNGKISELGEKTESNNT